MKPIYLDHSATTPVRPEVVTTLTRYLANTFGNPSSAHSFGHEAREGLNTARNQVAALIHAEPEEIIFTSGGQKPIIWPFWERP